MSLACGVGDDTKITRSLQNGEDGTRHAAVKHTLEIVRGHTWGTAQMGQHMGGSS